VALEATADADGEAATEAGPAAVGALDAPPPATHAPASITNATAWINAKPSRRVDLVSMVALLIDAIWLGPMLARSCDDPRSIVLRHRPVGVVGS
jgi:hypothetical protein